MPVEQIKALQSEKLVKLVKRVYDNVEYYRNLMDEKGVKPEDIKGVEDLHKLPFLSKADLREAYPFGLLATDLKDCVRIHSTSGTTGKRVVAFYTQNDIDVWDDCTARAIVAAGGSNEDIVQVCYGFGLFTGGAGLNGGSHKVGSLTLPMSSGNTDRQIQFMMDLGSTIICCTPSYAAYIGETLKEKGYKPEDNKLKAASLRLSTPTRARFSPRVQRVSSCSPLLIRKRSRLSVTAHAISACFPERSVPAAEPSSR